MTAQPNTQHPTPNTQHLPYAVALTAFVALIALWLTSGGTGAALPTIPVFGAAILASYFMSARMDAGGIFPWVLRAFLVFVIYTVTQDSDGGDLAIGPVRARNMFGQIWAMEMALRFWWRGADVTKNSLYALLFSGLLFLSASNTFEDGFIRYVAPLYVLAVAASALTYRERPGAARALWPRLALLGLALAFGFGGYRAIYDNKNRLNEIGDRIVANRKPLEGTAMAATPQLGRTFDLRGSNARVLKIENFVGDPHLRGLAFDSYEAGRWSPTFMERSYRPAAAELNPSEASAVSGAATMKATRLVSDNILVFVPLEAAAITATNAPNLEWAPDSGGPIRTPARPPFEYQVTVVEKEGHQGIPATPRLNASKLDAISDAYLKRCLTLPSGFDARIPALARRITAGAKTDKEKARTVESYLIANYRYSLEFQPTTRDPIIGFLLDEPKRAAHCEYFAASAALLLRCVGIPTRYVTGYYAHEGLGENEMVVRGRDAHAWCEAWVKGVGWVTVEATPGDGRPGGAGDDRLEWWRAAWERIQDTWEAFRTWLSNLPVEISYAVLALTGIGIVAYLYVRNRRRTPKLPDEGYTTPDERLATLAARFEAVFAKRGTPFPATRPYAEHLAQLNEERNEENAALIERGRTFAEGYNASRFGNRTDEAAVTSLRRLIEGIESMASDKK